MATAMIFVAVALVLDFFDGFLARALGASSDLGTQLDSLADLVTFGVVPGYILFQMIVISQGFYFVEIADWPTSLFFQAGIAALVPLGAAYRLAVFNLKEDRSSHFEGLPTPAMSMVVFGIPLVLELNYHLNFYHPLSDDFIQTLVEARKWDPSDAVIIGVMNNAILYQALAVFLCILMVSRIPMLSLKFKGFAWDKNKWSYAILIWAVVCYVIFVLPYVDLGPLSYGLIDYLILPIFMAGYFLLSFIYATFGRSKNKPTADEIQS